MGTRAPAPDVAAQGGSMSVALLLQLQSAEDRVAALQGEAVAVEGQIAGDPTLDQARVDAQLRLDEQTEVDGAVNDLDREVTSMRARARSLEKQLYGGSVRNPQDLLTMQRELDALARQLGEVEDRELQLMERAEEASTATRSADEQVAALERLRATEAAPLAKRLESVRTALVDAENARDEIRTRVPENELRLYKRVGARRHPAVVRIIEGACGGCRLPLGLNEVRNARVGPGLVQCANCDRILAP
jgi:predicted  nucleic acid-binding Zn-ribbon protein